jgi:hypothetical protein
MGLLGIGPAHSSLGSFLLLVLPLAGRRDVLAWRLAAHIRRRSSTQFLPQIRASSAHNDQHIKWSRYTSPPPTRRDTREPIMLPRRRDKRVATFVQTARG